MQSRKDRVRRKGFGLPIELMIVIIVLLAFLMIYWSGMGHAFKEFFIGIDAQHKTPTDNTLCLSACTNYCRWGFSSKEARNTLICGDKDREYDSTTSPPSCQDGAVPDSRYINCDCIECDARGHVVSEDDGSGDDAAAECTVHSHCLVDPAEPHFCCENLCKVSACPGSYTWTATDDILWRFIGHDWDDATTTYTLQKEIVVVNPADGLSEVNEKEVTGDILYNGGGGDGALIYFDPDLEMPAGLEDINKKYAYIPKEAHNSIEHSGKAILFNQDSINHILLDGPVIKTAYHGDIDILVQ